MSQQPRRLLRGTIIVIAAAAALVVWRVSRLPAPVAVPAATTSADVRVVYHVHTTRSDGTGTPDEVAAAAREAGVDVVILTDHGDATRVPDPPRRVHGVLVIEAVEVSTWAGHYVALGARPSPYPLGGLPESVVEDVARLGGMGVVAHPGSAKDDLKWRDWDTPFPAIEWLNADSEWRDRPARLWDAVVTYPWAPVATIAALLDRPDVELRAWDRHAARRPVVGLAAHDAHARIGLRGVGEPYDGAVAVRAPGYATMFRAFSNVVPVDRRSWGGDAAADAAIIVDALRAGRVYSVIGGRGDGRVEHFTATSGGVTVRMGEHLVPAGPVAFVITSNAPPTATTTLVCDGRPVTSTRGGALTWTASAAPGACRVEVTLNEAASARATWIVTNPIYVRDLRERAVPPSVLPAQVTVPFAGSAEAARWVAETSPGSKAVMQPGGDVAGRVVYDWQLAAGGREQFAALRLDTPADLASFDRMVVRASADRPMRVWLQLRTPADGGHRWGTSMYLDETPREVTLPFARFLSIDRRAGAAMPLAAVTALLLVSDTVHARPGERGRVRLDALWLAR
jgi:PHP domain